MTKRVEEARAKAVGVTEPWAKHAAEARVRRFADLLEKWKKPAGPPVRIQLQILRVGEVAMVAMPGEPFAEIGLAVKRASPFGVTMFCGYSTGEGGEYMPVESEYAFEGYEVDRTPYAPEAASIVVREASGLYAEVR